MFQNITDNTNILFSRTRNALRHHKKSDHQLLLEEVSVPCMLCDKKSDPLMVCVSMFQDIITNFDAQCIFDTLSRLINGQFHVPLLWLSEQEERWESTIAQSILNFQCLTERTIEYSNRLIIACIQLCHIHSFSCFSMHSLLLTFYDAWVNVEVQGSCLVNICRPRKTSL